MAQPDVRLDPRGPRFGATFPLVLAAVALVLGAGTPGTVVMAVLAVLFLPGAIVGPQATLQALLFKALIRPRLAAPTETESFRPPRFAQQVGLVLSVAAVVFGLVGVSLGFYICTAFVLAASFLNAVFGFCLGCEMYLLFTRLTTRAA